MSESIPMQTPLIDLLRGVPEALRGHWASQWNEDGLSTGHTVAPIEALEAMLGAAHKQSGLPMQYDEWEETLLQRVEGND